SLPTSPILNRAFSPTTWSPPLRSENGVGWRSRLRPHHKAKASSRGSGTLMGDGGLLGWATAALVKLDDEASGTLSRVLTAAPARRQAIFAALAAQEAKAGVFDAGEHLLPMTFAEVIRHGRAADILRHAYTELPEGLPGLLERVGEKPLQIGRAS